MLLRLVIKVDLFKLKKKLFYVVLFSVQGC